MEVDAGEKLPEKEIFATESGPPAFASRPADLHCPLPPRTRTAASPTPPQMEALRGWPSWAIRLGTSGGEAGATLPAVLLTSDRAMADDPRIASRVDAHRLASSIQVDDAVWVAQKALSAIRSEWEEATPLMRELDFKPKLLMFKTWLWAFATV
ncbi:hypothetical protein ZWY2020_011686 [Hordeum vulgare]|nr:hypothetical protein ZWY2020_011686 [Hordeum vulgare]